MKSNLLSRARCDIRAVELATIPGIDVVGYSRLMGEDEAGTT
jgi:hypothetical protein